MAVDLSLDGVRACPTFDFGGSVTPNRLFDLYGRGVAVIGIGADPPAKVTVDDGAAASRRPLASTRWQRHCSRSSVGIDAAGSDLIYPVNI